MYRRTPVLVIILRFYLVVFAIFFGIATLVNWSGGRVLIDWSLTWSVPAVLTAMFIFGGWPVVTIATEIICYGDPVYKLAKKQTGFRPYWDSLPPLINPSTNAFFGPPVKYAICPRCEGCVDSDPTKPINCPHCGYGSDGDYSAYFAKHGYVRPAGMSEADWNRILATDRQRNNCANGSCGLNVNEPEDWQPMGG
jgi:hypothetical protein